MPGTDLAPMGDREIEQTFRLANGLFKSGMFKDVKQAEQAFAKILIGRDLGLSPTQAMLGIHLIEGKPELSANLQAAFVKRTPGYDYRVTEHTDDACTIVFLRDGDQIGESRFTMDDAKRAGLAGRGPWKTYPRNMLFARAMSNGVAFHCPEVTGGVRVYSDGEIGGEELPPELPPEPIREPTEDTAFDLATGEIIEEAEVAHDPDPELQGMLEEVVENKVWTLQRALTQLVAHGVTDTSNIDRALRTLPPDGTDALKMVLYDLLDDAEDQAQSEGDAS